MFAARSVVALAPLPKVPSVAPIYKGTLSTTTDETTTIFSAVDIGVPHPKRIVVLTCYLGAGSSSATVTVNGISPWFRNTAAASPQLILVAFKVPVGTLADIEVTLTGSLRKAIGVYVAYPQNHAVLDTGSAFTTGTTAAVVSDLKVQAGGFAVYIGVQNASLSTYITTWGGADAVIENDDAIMEAVASYTFGHILVTISSDLDDLTLTPLLTGNKHLVAAAWGPPSPGN